MSSNTILYIIAGVLLVVLILIVIYYYYSQSSAASQVNTTSPSVYPAGLTEGEVVRCATTGNIYQLVNGAIQWYPSSTVYAKYGNPAYTNIDCNVLASIPPGPNLS